MWPWLISGGLVVVGMRLGQRRALTQFGFEADDTSGADSSGPPAQFDPEDPTAGDDASLYEEFLGSLGAIGRSFTGNSSGSRSAGCGCGGTCGRCG